MLWTGEWCLVYFCHYLAIDRTERSLEVFQTYNLNTHLRKQPTLLVVSSWNNIQEMTAEISIAGVSLRSSGECILLPEANFPHSMTIQSDSDMSYRWDFCVLVSFCGETWHTEMSAVFSTLFPGWQVGENPGNEVETDRTHFKRFPLTLSCALYNL